MSSSWAAPNCCFQAGDSCCLSWREAVQKILGDEFQKRKLANFITYGSDCSGLDAPYWGLQYVLSDIEAGQQMNWNSNCWFWHHQLQLTINTQLNCVMCCLMWGAPGAKNWAWAFICIRSSGKCRTSTKENAAFEHETRYHLWWPFGHRPASGISGQVS